MKQSLNPACTRYPRKSPWAGPSGRGATLHNLGFIYNAQGRYAEAEPLLRRALIIREAALGPQHLEVALNPEQPGFHLGVRSRYEEAEPLYERALAIRESILGPGPPGCSVRNE
ncbi:MAG: hypothetical protein CM1200mP14_19420 [Gammaproteobacteria bacterium]|nr:MAG: hypothetical protein CM1200mP14_19420 [Gammaproteobacteria bacterium]